MKGQATGRGRQGVRAFTLGCLLAGAAQAQSPVVSLPRPDSAGWIRLFRGNNAADFYTFMGTSRMVPSLNRQAFPNNVFTVVGGDTIQSSGSPAGHLLFRQPFSHYRLQFQLRWPGSLGNTGLLTKVQEDDTAQSQGFPRSVECQGDPGQGMGQIWALGSIGGQNGGTWITFRGKTIPHPASWAAGQQARQYDPASPVIDFGGGGDPYNNLIVGRPGWMQPRPAALNNGGWVTIEVESHGRDTTRHYVDTQLVMEYWNPRIAPRNDGSQASKYLTSGLFAWQSEGSRVWFRNIRIKLLPQDPLYASLYTTAGFRDARILRRSAARPMLEFARGVPLFRTTPGNAATVSGRRAGLSIP